MNWLDELDLSNAWRGWLPFADIPAPLERFKTGEPVLTIFAEARKPPECLKTLERDERVWLDRLLSWAVVENP